jgi:hypothetical protein
MKSQSQNPAKARPAARSEELKPFASPVAARKSLMGAGIVFDGRPLRNRFQFPMAFIGHQGRKFQNAFRVP